MRLAVTVLVLVAGCAETPKLESGDRCQLTSECAAPLVCRLERCRRECATTRDCPIGSNCVFDERGFGGCQTLPETECERNSQCPSPLVCRFGQCTNECMTHEDCPAGAACLNEPDGNACVDRFEMGCQITSECPEPLVCAVDERCRPACRTDRDCRDGRACVMMGADLVCGPRPDAGPPIDAGPDGGPPAMDAGRDGGPMTMDAGRDSGPPDGGTRDAGPRDAGPRDAGPPDGGPPDGGPPDSGPPPLDAGPPSTLASLGLGALHSCRVLAGTGAVQCWGLNSDSQVGNGGTMDVLSPMTVIASGMIEAAGGGRASCARSATEMYCWGFNGTGGLATGDTTIRRMPALSMTGSFVPVQLDLGTEHGCGVDAAGAVWCWGRNDSGQIGNGVVGGMVTVPVMVTMLGGPADQVAAGAGHTCARLRSGSVRCWGADGFGQLGNDAAIAGSAVPVTVMGITDAVWIGAGTHHACAVTSLGSVRCWGNDEFGQVGDGTADPGAPATPLPRPAVTGITDAIRVGAGIDHTCVLRSSGIVSCFGNNMFLQLGRPMLMPRMSAVPVDVMGVTGATELSVGEHHGCLRDASGVRCWGRNTNGQLGIGSTTNQSTPMSVP